MTRETVNEILHGLDTVEANLEITTGGVTLYASALVYSEMWRYFDYLFIDTIDPSAGHGQVYNDYKTAWTQYIQLHAADLKRAYDAMAATYNPLHNYDMTEQAADGERNGDQTVTTTPHGKVTNETSLSGTLETATSFYKSGVDSTGDGVMTDKSVSLETPTTRKTTTETTYAAGTDSEQKTVHTHDQTASADGHTITAADRATEHYLTRSGNIGVTSSMQLIQAEVDLRAAQELLEKFVRRFIDKHCIYIGGV